MPMAATRTAAEPVAPRIIRGSRGKTSAYLLGSLAFVGTAIWLLNQPTVESVWLWPCLAFFGLGALVFTWLLIRPQVLILDASGFKLSGGLIRSPKYIPWRDVQGFFVYRLPVAGSNLVGYNFEPDARKDASIIRWNRRLGADDALPDGWSLSAEKMAEELNAYRLQALNRTV